MAHQKEARKIGQPLIIIFMIIIILIALIWVYAKWSGTNLTKWGTDLPVVSTLFPDEKSSDTVQLKQMENLKARIQDQDAKIADLKQSANNKDKKITTLEDKLSSIQQKNNKQQNEQPSLPQQETNKGYKEIARVYADMAPDSAAAILSKLKNDKVVKILSEQKSDTAAIILENMKPDKAATLTVLLAGENQ